MAAQVLRHASEIEDVADYVVLCTKVILELDRVALIPPAVTTETTIVFIQNGVEIEQEIVSAFPDNEVISGLAFICCNRINVGEIAHLAYGSLALGNLSGFISHKTGNLCTLFSRASIECEASADIKPPNKNQYAIGL